MPKWKAWQLLDAQDLVPTGVVVELGTVNREMLRVEGVSDLETCMAFFPLPVRSCGKLNVCVHCKAYS